MVHPNEGVPGGIRLKWRLSSFLPFPVDYSINDHIQEQINPTFFAEEHPNETCISLSAMLINTRFALSQGIIPAMRPWEMFEPEFLQLELDMNLIVAGIGKYNHWFSLLESYVSYWAEFHGCSNYSTDQLKSWEDVKGFQFIQRFQQDISPFPCKKAEFSVVCSRIEKVLDNKDQNISSLAKCINQFIDNSLSPKKNSDLKKLLEFICRVRKKDDLSITEPITTEEQIGIIKKSLFEAAQSVTDRFNVVDGNSKSWSREMNEAIKEVTDLIFVSKNEMRKDLFFRYISGEKGCVAILKIKYQKKNRYYLSFSGMNDCDSFYALEKAHILLPFCQPLSAFESVCKHLSEAYRCDITYVPFAAEIVKHIERYGISDRDLQNMSLYHPRYTYAITMDSEINNTIFDAWPYPVAEAHYKVNYACCERKILAYLKAKGIHPEGSKAEWYIKFYPCIQCSHAIDQWRRENHITKLIFTIPDLNS